MSSPEELQRLVIDQQQQIAAMQAEKTRESVAAALRDSLAPHVQPALVPQAVALLEQNVHLVNDGTGKQVPCGPGLQPLPAFVESQLQGSLSHFKQTGPGPTPGPGSTPAPAPAGISAETLALTQTGRGAGQYIMDRMMNRRAVQGNGQLDMSQAFGLPRRGA